MAKIINSKNAKILASEKNENENFKECSCPKNKECVLEEKCLQKNLVYNAKVTSEKEVKNYIGLCSTDFKSRLAVHKQSFKDGKTNQTSLSKYITKLKNEKIEYDLKWKIIDRGKTYSPVTNTCQLCIKEAYHIIFNPQLSDLNSKSELFASCRHKKSELICNKS